jgi:hypothetical protein
MRDRITKIHNWKARYSNEVEKMTREYNAINQTLPTVTRKATPEEIAYFTSVSEKAMKSQQNQRQQMILKLKKKSEKSEIDTNNIA